MSWVVLWTIENQKEKEKSYLYWTKIFNSIKSFYSTSNTSIQGYAPVKKALRKENWFHQNECSDFQRAYLMWNRNKAVEQIPLWILWMNVLREGYAMYGQGRLLCKQSFRLWHMTMKIYLWGFILDINI